MSPHEKSLRERLHARCQNQPISFRDYIETVLYTEALGYYARRKQRVGRSSERDFYTAQSLGPVFSRLVVGGASGILGRSRSARASFVEIAPEPEAALLDNAGPHPFAARREIRLGEPLQLKGDAVVFANEWLDALPFHRLIFKDGRWQERGVQAVGADGLEEVLLEKLSKPVADRIDRLPETAPENYAFDWSIEAEDTLEYLLAQPWEGLLLLFDYGRDRRTLLSEMPGGSARGYRQHRQVTDLLAAPGETDITCDLCWDDLQALLANYGFAPVTLETQESFIVKRAAETAEAIVADGAGCFSKERQTLMELMHPSHMGRRFQILWGLRA